ncbi:putative Ca2+/H+ antiporter (TMEM165/GDT1 family) [Nocardioides albertanoniae]|uniref:GDT1 family protein n=1 Tax=Nocardioides albertanoniae TaxID=1175486 RepID=A0A543A0R4_9ACTN|nr:TMEM165/GDT1 family protein [Nocardioides albertanoniae]TQL66183.1 putative Ca2+/H+ antiporter (TMEM165/GDT1 family) [Nocardioides albertanoniae]
MDITVIALAFAAIFVVELPDKTFLATLVLSTKYRPLFVWIGVGVAFGVQTLIAVAVGGVATLLPTTLIHVVAALLFLGGAVFLFIEGRRHHGTATEEDASEFADKAKDVRGFRQVLASFMVLFAAEWGDLSQLLSVSLVARYHEPVAVFVGSWAALLTVSGLAVLLGRTLLRFIKLHVLHYVGAVVCLALGILTFVEVFA